METGGNLGGSWCGVMYMTTTPSGTPQTQLRMGQGPAHPAVVVWYRVPDSSFHLDLATETVTQDADFAFVAVQDR